MNKGDSTTYNKERMLGSGSWEWSIKDPNSVMLSHYLCELLELDYRALFNIDEIDKLIYGPDKEELHEVINYHITGKKDLIDVFHRMKKTTKEVVRFNTRITCIYEDDILIAMIGVCVDLSFNNKRDYSTRLNNEKFYRLFGEAPIGIALLRLDGNCFLTNESLVESVGYKEYELKNEPIQMVIEEEDQHMFNSLYQSVIDDRINSFRREFRIVTKGGQRVWHDLTLTSVKDVNDEVKYLIVMMQPTIRNQETNIRKGLVRTIREELVELSLKDNLSGLYNRQYIIKKIKEFILVYYEKHMNFSVLLVDVDHIKNINDKYGHTCGDKVIHDLADMFRIITRETDICARWGGEEFILLLPDITIDIATDMAHRLRNEVKDTILMWEGNELNITVSIAVTEYTEDDTMRSFVKKLDKALYDDKEDMRDCVRIL